MVEQVRGVVDWGPGGGGERFSLCEGCKYLTSTLFCTPEAKSKTKQELNSV